MRKNKTNQILDLYHQLLKQFGHPLQGQWKLWCRRPKTSLERQEVVIGAVLTQNTNWQNVDKAVENLKSAKVCSLAAVLQIPLARLKTLIKPARFYNAKAGYLRNIARFWLKNKNLKGFNKTELQDLRRQLLDIKGIGFETADDILLYALDRPSFVIDEYTKRLVKEKNLSQNLSYTHLQKLFINNLPADYGLYQDFHALIVMWGKNRIGNNRSVLYNLHNPPTI